MFYTILFLGVSLVFGVLGQGTDVCVSDPVENLSIEPDHLEWKASENCEVSFYVVHVIDDNDIIYHYTADSESFDITFLPVCETYRFIVTPVTVDNVEGRGATASAKIRPPTEENFTISEFNITETGRNSAVIEWSLSEEQQRCIDLYRVVIWDEDGNIPHDVYVEENYFNFTRAVPCMNYQFGVRAIYNPEEDEPIYIDNYTFPGVPPNPPVLRSLTEGVTSVNMTWVLQTYAQNRCPISELNIDASPFFNLSHPIDDTPERLPVAFELINLQPNTIYLSLVSVVNNIGRSSALTIAIQTRPDSTDFDEDV